MQPQNAIIIIYFILLKLICDTNMEHIVASIFGKHHRKLYIIGNMISCSWNFPTFSKCIFLLSFVQWEMVAFGKKLKERQIQEWQGYVSIFLVWICSCGFISICIAGHHNGWCGRHWEIKVKNWNYNQPLVCTPTPQPPEKRF